MNVFRALAPPQLFETQKDSHRFLRGAETNAGNIKGFFFSLSNFNA